MKKAHHLFELILPTLYSDHTCWIFCAPFQICTSSLQRGQTLLKYPVRSIPGLWINPFTIFFATKFFPEGSVGDRLSRLTLAQGTPLQPNLHCTTCTDQCPAYSENCTALLLSALHYTSLRIKALACYISAIWLSATQCN